MKFGDYTFDANICASSADGCPIIALALDLALAAIQARCLFGVHAVSSEADLGVSITLAGWCKLISLGASILLIPSGTKGVKDILHDI